MRNGSIVPLKRLSCFLVAGALLKAVCVCSGLVSLSSQDPLEHQLMQRWGGGVELHSWSELPTGSGLGEKLTNTKIIRTAEKKKITKTPKASRYSPKNK